MNDTRTGVERLRAGEPFFMPDWDIVALMEEGKRRAAEYNARFLVDAAQAIAMLPQLFGKVGENSIAIPTLSVEFGFNIEMGTASLVNMNCTLMDCFRIVIGDRVQIGPSTLFFTGGHALNARERRVRDADGKDIGTVTTGAPIVVADDVWIGGGSIILAGVTIGARTTIGAGSVVTKSIPSEVLAAGNPCRVIRQIDSA